MRVSALSGLAVRAVVVGAAVVLGGLPGVSPGDPIQGIGPTGAVQRVATGFAFTEGPAFRDGILYFTDIPNERIHRVGRDGKVGVFAEKSRHANGLMFDRQGRLLACEMDGQLAAYDTTTGARRVLAKEFGGARFNAVNDLVIDSHGGVYFTDPRFRAPEPFPQGGQHVYYWSAAGGVVRVTPNLPAPNGVLLSRDEKTLYVLPSDSASMRVFSITSPGKADGGREFCKVRQPPDGSKHGSDGAALDEQGNLYLTTQLGVQVFAEGGGYLGVIPVPEKPANCTFGGADGKTLFITARKSVYAAPMSVAGWRYGGLKRGQETVNAP